MVALFDEAKSFLSGKGLAREQFALLGVELNREKTKVVDTLKGETFGFLGFDLRRVRKRKGGGHFILMTPKKKARMSIKAKVRDIVRRGGATPMPELVKRINATLGEWANYFRVGNSSRAFSEVRDYVERKVRILLTRRKRRRKSSVGWRRWSNEYLYDVLGLYWDWKSGHKEAVPPGGDSEEAHSQSGCRIRDRWRYRLAHVSPQLSVEAG